MLPELFIPFNAIVNSRVWDDWAEEILTTALSVFCYHWSSLCNADLRRVNDVCKSMFVKLEQAYKMTW